MAIKGKVTVDLNYCKGCGLCVEFCPKKVLKIDTERVTNMGYNPAAMANEDECIACGICYRMCPDSAITVEKI